MSDFETLLLHEQRNPNATILQFFLSKYESEEIVVVVEGPDDQTFYFDFISDYFPGKRVFFFPCSGKSSLIALKVFLDSYELGVQPERLLFLADKDFDDYLRFVDAGIYKTCVYSIENYFVDQKYFEYVLRKFGAGQLSSRAVDELVAVFEDQLQKAIAAMLVPMAVLCAIRALDRRADFDAISYYDLVKGGVQPIERNRGERARVLSELVRPGELVDFKSVMTFARAFRKDHFNLWLRGKHGLQLARAVIRCVGARYPQFSVMLRGVNSFFGTEAFRQAKSFLGDVASLRLYCKADS
ncbi:DUF4435 domain-containing protein [Bradyrhizobium sp. HKCCYLRH3061]|uniref:DUF4435 domain-containing protein n=1 Tax=Bradyrhizobium sp. HKCCYLRH3061 TaxID=3420734 RepID=UPI003EBF2EEA